MSRFSSIGSFVSSLGYSRYFSISQVPRPTLLLSQSENQTRSDILHKSSRPSHRTSIPYCTTADHTMTYRSISYHTIPLLYFILHLYLYCTCSRIELVLCWLPLIIDSTLGYWLGALLTLPNAPHPLNVVDHHHHPTIVINVLSLQNR